MTFVMNYGSYVLVPVHLLVCLILIAVVLLQSGKATDWAGAFGGAGSQAAFGPRGVENTLSRLTKIAAVVFMITSFSLALIQSKREVGGLPDLPEAGATSAPEAPAVPAAQPGAPAEPPAAAPLEQPAAVPPEQPADLPPADGGESGANNAP